MVCGGLKKKAGKQGAPGHRTHRSDPRSTGLHQACRNKSNTSVRKSPFRKLQKKFGVLLCTSLRALCHTVWMRFHSLWIRCPHARSGQWKRAGLPVAERVLSAELRWEITLRNIAARRTVFLTSCFSILLDYFQEQKKRRWIFPFYLKEFLPRRRNLMFDCL